MPIQITATTINRCLWMLVALMLFFLVGTAVYHQWGRDLPMGANKLLLVQLSLAFENVVAAWAASMLLLIAGLLAAAAFFADRHRFPGRWQGVVSTGWLFTAAVFGLLSFDEMGSVHETIGDSRVFSLLSNGAGWVMFEVVVVGVGIIMIAFGWLRLRKVPLALVLFMGGVLLYLTNPLQENIEIAALRAAPDPALWKRPLHFLLLEEGSELAGSFYFIAACIVYLKKRAAAAGFHGILLAGKGGDRRMQPVWWGVLAAGALLLLLQDGNQPHQTETGIALNWFPASLAFTLFLAALYFAQQAQSPHRKFFILAALVALAISVAAGIDLLGMGVAKNSLFKGGVAGLCLVVFGLLVWLWQPQRSLRLRLWAGFWALFTAASFFLPPLFAALFLYFGLCCLLGILALPITRQQAL